MRVKVGDWSLFICLCLSNHLNTKTKIKGLQSQRLRTFKQLAESLRGRPRRGWNRSIGMQSLFLSLTPSWKEYIRPKARCWSQSRSKARACESVMCHITKKQQSTCTFRRFLFSCWYLSLTSVLWFKSRSMRGSVLLHFPREAYRAQSAFSPSLRAGLQAGAKIYDGGNHLVVKSSQAVLMVQSAGTSSPKSCSSCSTSKSSSFSEVKDPIHYSFQ